MLEDLIKAAVNQFLETPAFKAMVTARAEELIDHYMEYDGARLVEQQVQDQINTVDISISVN